MSGSIVARMPQRAAFIGFNAAALLAFGLVVVAPLVERFSDRADAIAQDGAEVARQRDLRAQALSVASGVAPSGDLFLSGQDAAMANADLQQTLKALAGASGVRFTGVRGLMPAGARPGDHMVTARLDVEGSLAAIDALVRAIEGHTPYLFVGALTMRANGSGPRAAQDDITAQLTVLGAFKRSSMVREGG